MSTKRKYSGSGIALGVALGTALGVALDNIGLWLALGVAFGAAFEGVTVQGAKGTEEEGDSGVSRGGV